MTRYGKTMMEALSEVREGYSPKQIKMAIGIASDKRYAGGNMSGAVAAIEKIKKGLSDHKQVAAVLKRQNEDMNCGCGKTPCETYGEKDELDESSKAKRDAMRAMGKRGVDPADIDEPKASKKDKESAGKNIVIQLRKAKDSRGNVDIEFQDGKKQKVDPKIIDAMLKAYDMIPKPNDKEKFTKLISKSYRDMLKTTKMVSKQLRMGEEVELEESKSSTGYDLYHKTFSGAMQHAYAFAKKKFGMEIDPEEIDNKVAMGPKKPSNGKTNSYRLKAKGSKKGIQVQVANLDNKRYELNMYKEEVELQELTSAEKKLINQMYDKKGNLTPFGKKVMDHGKGKKEGVEPVQWPSQPLPEEMDPTDHVKKKGDKYCVYNADGSIAKEFDNKEDADKYAIANHDKMMATAKKEVKEEEEPNKPDSAKEVEKGRDDKKKTRIAQLQLQIAKAQETINKMNAQEK